MAIAFPMKNSFETPNIALDFPSRVKSPLALDGVLSREDVASAYEQQILELTPSHKLLESGCHDPRRADDRRTRRTIYGSPAHLA